MNWEKKNNHDPKLGRIRGGGNPRGRKRGSRGGQSRQLNSVKSQNKKIKKEARKLVATLMVEAANDGARNTQGQNRGNNDHQNPNPGSQNNGNNPNVNTNNSGERIKASLRKMISGNNNGNVIEDRFTGGDVTNNATTAGRLGRSRKASMAFVKAASQSGDWIETAVLFDGGAMPNSCVSEKLVRELKLEDRIVGGETAHNNATRGSKFESLGWVTMKFKLPDGCEFAADMKVADMNTELMFGEALLRRLKVTIDFVTNNIHVLAARTKLSVIAADEWSLVSRIAAADFEGEAAVPKR